jgi:glucokinase
MSERILLSDVGGTNVRFAVLAGGVIGPIERLAVAKFANFDDALAAYFASHRDAAGIRKALFAVAGVVEGERCKLTNNPWLVDGAALRARFGFAEVGLVNDFEAVAWSLPSLTGEDLSQLGGGKPKAAAPLLALGPGTGLGVAVYLPAGGGTVLGSEGGHTTLPGGTPREDAIIALLRERFGHVSAERVLSGPGLQNLYRTVAALDGVSVPERRSSEISRAAIAGTCPVSRAALDIFCAVLGEVAGNFALTFAAQGGVYLGGGIVPHMRDYLPRSQFRARFDAKGRMSAYVQAIPAYLILHDDPAFIGLKRLAERA